MDTVRRMQLEEYNLNLSQKNSVKKEVQKKIRGYIKKNIKGTIKIMPGKQCHIGQ